MRLTKTARVLLWGANVWYFGEGMFGPLFAVFAQKVGGDILDITWAWAFYLIVTGILYIIVGRVINKRKYEAEVMVAGYALNAIFTFCYLFVSNPMELFLVQVGLGIAEAVGTPAWDSLFAKNVPKESDTYAWGMASGQSQIVTGIAFFCGGLITHFLSFNTLFATMGIVQVFATLLQARILIKKD